MMTSASRTAWTLSMENFCQHAHAATDECKPLGSWFQQLVSDPIDWGACNDTSPAVLAHDAAEDHAIRQLFAIHELKPSDSYQLNDLCRIVTPEEQWDIWQEIIEKIPSDATTLTPAA
jgi:hypothetical protein